jgi:hypothetical protein
LTSRKEDEESQKNGETLDGDECKEIQRIPEVTVKERLISGPKLP